MKEGERRVRYKLQDREKKKFTDALEKEAERERETEKENDNDRPPHEPFSSIISECESYYYHAEEQCNRSCDTVCDAHGQTLSDDLRDNQGHFILYCRRYLRSFDEWLA